MGRKTLSQSLNIWMNGELVGRWNVSASGEHSFRYDESWYESPRFRPLSLSLPPSLDNLPCRGAVVEAFFDNLLPDSVEIRRRIQMRFGIGSSRAFALLSQIGRDCVGAVQVLTEDEVPKGIRRIEGDEQNDAMMAARLRDTTANQRFLISADDFRISLAGAQEKNAFLFCRGKWLKPKGATPTTHILKLPLGSIGGGAIDLSSSVENEWLCLRLLDGFGLKVPKAQILTFEDQKVLSVLRFDRRLSSDGSWLLRLPQEDFCQATGTPPGMKYESDGGPGIRKNMELLLGANDSFSDRRSFMKSQLLFWLMGAVDGHAKNFSIFLEAGGRFRMTPFYDVLSIYPVVGKGAGKIATEKIRMAMAVTGSKRYYKWQKILRRHWFSTASICGFPAGEMEQILDEVVASTPRVIECVQAILPPGFPDPVAEAIFNQVKAASERLAL